MTNYINSSNREIQENLYAETEQKAVKSSKVFSILNGFWQHLFVALANNQEPRIWHSTDRFGNTWWHGYDPVTERSTYQNSEQEIRAWLEERYYQ